MQITNDEEINELREFTRDIYAYAVDYLPSESPLSKETLLINSFCGCLVVILKLSEEGTRDALLESIRSHLVTNLANIRAIEALEKMDE